MPRNESIRMITNDSNWHSQRYYFSISRRISAKQLPPHTSSEKKNHLVILIKKDTTPKCHYNPRIKEIIHLSFYESTMYLVCCVMLI